jgi:hypothetical protein
MTIETLESRLTALEQEVMRLKKRREPSDSQPWWERIRGRFKDDPDYVEAMRLGREWRESGDRGVAN